ncbi:MAG: hypothetical protein QXU20_00405 [Candidatus Woesearchaeota archaeon]
MNREGNIFGSGDFCKNLSNYNIPNSNDSISQPPEGTWFNFYDTIKVRIPELLRREIEERKNGKDNNKERKFNPLKKFVSFVTLIVLGYNSISIPKTTIGNNLKSGFVNGEKKAEIVVDKKNPYSFSGEGLYNILNLDSSNKYEILDFENLEKKIEEVYAKDVLSYGSNDKKVLVRKDFNNNYFLKDLSSKKEIPLELKNETVNDIYVGEKIYLSTKENNSDFSKIIFYDKNLNKKGNLRFYTGKSSIRDFEVKENKKGIESILITLDNNQVRRIVREKEKYVFKEIWNLNYLKNDVLTCATEVGSYIMFGTENGKIGFYKKNNPEEVYFLKLKEEDNFAVKELKIKSIKYDEKTKRAIVDFSAVRSYGVVDYSVKL